MSPEAGVSVLDHRVLALDLGVETERIAAFLRGALGRLKRRGLVVAISGGVDSGVCAALAVRAVGAERVAGLLLPERDSSPRSTELGRAVADTLGIAADVIDIAPAVAALGCYRDRDAAIRTLVPAYNDGWKSKIVIRGGLEGAFNRFDLVVRPPDGAEQRVALPLRPYLQIVAAQNLKQRVRKALEYTAADRLNFAVIGTPNRLEYDQGFFVKNGDGAADIKPIAHLYKAQVYALARHLGLPEAVATAEPTTDTYSLPQGQDEFYFALPWKDLDLALWALDHGHGAEALATALSVPIERAAFVLADLQSKRDATRGLHAAPLLVEPNPAIRPP